jgi:outer membrane lipoprotein-sorting protein
MNKEQTLLDQAVKALSESTIPAGPSDDLIRQTLDQVEKEQSTIPFMERIGKMKSNSKFAAAAIIIIGVSVIFLFNSTPDNIALADVYARVQQVQAYMYEVSMTMSGMGELLGVGEMNDETKANMTVTISQQYGMKMENHMTVSMSQGQTQNITQLAYLLPEEKTMVSIMPEQKRYQTIEFTDDLLEQTKQQNNDPREMIKRMLGCDYIELGHSEIDGISVQGFQTTDHAFMMDSGADVKAILWVDVETWMPVRSEIWARMSGMEISYQIDKYQWNIPVTAADFEYDIPEDYQDQGSMVMPEMTEEGAIQGLQVYSKIFGEYPEKIDMSSLIPSLVKKMSEMAANPQTEYAQELVDKMKNANPDESQSLQQQLQQESTKITGLALFHMRLLQDKKDVAYYGDQVTPNDGDMILMRWKVEGDTYKVIFGDLTTAEMQYEDLIKVEPQQQAIEP